MQIHVLQFDAKVGLGTFSDWLTELGCEITSWRCDRLDFPLPEVSGPFLLLGGYMGVNDREKLGYLQAAADWIAAEVKKDRPLLAICLGSQLLAHALGAEVCSQRRQEKGLREIALTAVGEADPLFASLPNPFVSFEWHNDSFELPETGMHLAETAACPAQAFRYRNAWGVQFHPEVDAQIVADWCERTGAGLLPLIDFERQQQVYFEHSKRLLKNFISVAAKL